MLPDCSTSNLWNTKTSRKEKTKTKSNKKKEKKQKYIGCRSSGTSTPLTANSQSDNVRKVLTLAGDIRLRSQQISTAAAESNNFIPFPNSYTATIVSPSQLSLVLKMSRFLLVWTRLQNQLFVQEGLDIRAGHVTFCLRRNNATGASRSKLLSLYT